MSEKLSDLLLKASGEEPVQQQAPTTKHNIAKIVKMHTLAEEQGECPQCGYKAPLTDFEMDSTGDESGDNDDTDKEPWETADEAGETALAQRLLKQAGLANKQQDTKAEPKKLSRDQVQNILNTAVANLRNPRS